MTIILLEEFEINVNKIISYTRPDKIIDVRNSHAHICDYSIDYQFNSLVNLSDFFN